MQKITPRPNRMSKKRLGPSEHMRTTGALPKPKTSLSKPQLPVILAPSRPPKHSLPCSSQTDSPGSLSTLVRRVICAYKYPSSQPINHEGNTSPKSRSVSNHQKKTGEGTAKQQIKSVERSVIVGKTQPRHQKSPSGPRALPLANINKPRLT